MTRQEELQKGLQIYANEEKQPQTGVNLGNLRRHELSHDEDGSLARAIEKFKDNPDRIDTRPISPRWSLGGEKNI